MCYLRRLDLREGPAPAGLRKIQFSIPAQIEDWVRYSRVEVKSTAPAWSEVSLCLANSPVLGVAIHEAYESVRSRGERLR